MQDRIPLHPGRVTLTPVAGQANTYDMFRADQPAQAGTPINKASLLKDATAAMFGLGANALPDDVLAYLGQFAEHWWRAYSDTAWTEYTEKRTNVSGTAWSTSSSITVQVAESISIDQSTGEITLVAPSNYTLSPSTDYDTRESNAAAAQSAIVPGYLKVSDGTIYYFPDGSLISADADYGTMSFPRGSVQIANPTAGSSATAQIVTTDAISHSQGTTEYLQSTNRNAYPDSGTVGNVTYAYLGIPLQNLPTATRIATGSYIGTGTYGIDSKNSLQFDFSPKLVLITYQRKDSIYGYYAKHTMFVFPEPYGENYGRSSSSAYAYTAVEWSANAISWYQTGKGATPSAAGQLNEANKEYYYVAFG